MERRGRKSKSSCRPRCVDVEVTQTKPLVVRGAGCMNVAEQDAFINDVLTDRTTGPNLNEFFFPLNPSTNSILVGLVANVYRLAEGLPIVFNPGVELVQTFTFDSDPVPTLGALWVSTTDPTLGYLTFRGTVGLFETALDALYYQVAIAPGILVHYGFNAAYAGMAPQIRQAITSRGITSVNFGGHSLGGALALLSVYDLFINSTTISEAQVYTYAAPRVGNVAFATALDNALEVQIQVRAENDPIVSAPLAVMVSVIDLTTVYYYQYSGQIEYFRSFQPTLFGSHSLENYIGYVNGTSDAVSICVCP